MSLILASQSPRRKELLGQLGLEFTVQVADIDETTDPAIAPQVEVERLSREKAAAVTCDPATVVVAADTIVVLDGEVLGKPKSTQDATAMLTALSGREHLVCTGVTAQKGTEVHSYVETTKVTFRNLSPQEIAAYIATGEPMDKAGSYGIQGLGGCFVSHLEGDYFNVMGLPICSLTHHLRMLGIPILQTV